MRGFLRFLRSPRKERVFLVFAVISMITIRVALVLFPARSVARLAGRLGNQWRGRVSLPFSRALRRVAQAERSTSSFTTCLSTAIAGRLLLACAGHAAEVQIGVDKSTGRFRAHAWLVTPDNDVIGDRSPGGTEYVPLTGAERFFA